MAVHRFDVCVDAGPVIEVESGEVQLTDVSGIVHVPKENVHILSCAKTCNIILTCSKFSLFY